MMRISRRFVFIMMLMTVPILLVLLLFITDLAFVRISLGSLAVLASLTALWVLRRDRRATQNRDELATIYEIAQAITASSTDPTETLQTILNTVKRIVHYDGGEICLYEPETDGVRVCAWQGTFGEDSRGRLYKLGEGFTGGMAKTRTSMLVSDILQHESIRAVHSNLGKGATVRSFVGVPLLNGDDLVGTLELVSATPNKFNSHTCQLLETVAPQAAIAIQNAHKVEARERQLQAQIKRLQIQIDQNRRARQVDELTDTQYFRELKAKARRLQDRDDDEK